jgi:hypothetical protein
MLEELEQHIKIQWPDQFKKALIDPSDPIHAHTTLLVPDKVGLQNIFEANERMRAYEWKQWPDWLMAFATNECGDYFAFDTRALPYRIFYIDPIGSVAESIASCEQEGFVFGDFSAWYEYEISLKPSHATGNS